MASTLLLGVFSPKKNIVLKMCCFGYLNKYLPWNVSPFFNRVQAITSILAATLTRIFVLIPCSLSLPFISREKYSTKYLFLVVAMTAA